jgi:hypothetical protein
MKPDINYPLSKKKCTININILESKNDFFLDRRIIPLTAKADRCRSLYLAAPKSPGRRAAIFDKIDGQLLVK